MVCSVPTAYIGLCRNCFLGHAGNIGLYLKIISQKWTSSVFGSTYLHQTFTESVPNQKTHLIFWRFLVFIYIIDDHSCLNCYISIKISLIVYLINKYTDMSIYQIWLQVLECLLILFRFLEIFIYYDIFEITS